MTEKRTIPRSEEVRVRRERKQDKRQKKASEQAYRTMPPVTSRERAGYSNTQPRRKTNVRRYNAAVAARRESRFQLPALPSLQTGPRLIPLILVLALGAAAYFLLASPTFRVSEAQVNGLSRLSAAEVNSALDLGGEIVFFLRPEEIVSRLRVSYPEIESAQVTVSMPNQVIVDVKERQPVIFWQQGSGFTWIDENGVAFRPSGDLGGLVPVAAEGTPPGGPAPADDPLNTRAFLAPDMVKTVLTLAPNLPQGSTLIYEQDGGFGWMDSRGWQVSFGTESKDAALKLQIYQSLVDSLTARGITPAYVSVIHADAPFYRMEK